MVQFMFPHSPGSAIFMILFLFYSEVTRYPLQPEHEQDQERHAPYHGSEKRSSCATGSVCQLAHEQDQDQDQVEDCAKVIAVWTPAWLDVIGKELKDHTTSRTEKSTQSELYCSSLAL